MTVAQNACIDVEIGGSKGLFATHAARARKCPRKKSGVELDVDLTVFPATARHTQI